MKDLFFANKDLIKKFGEIIEKKGTNKSSSNKKIVLCEVPLEKGYVYEVDTIVFQSVSNNGSINNYIDVENATLIGDLTRGTGNNGGGTYNRAIVKATSDNAKAICSTYAFDASITYTGYIKARKIAII